MEQLFHHKHEALCYMILRYLLPKELARLRATNRRFQQLVQTDDFWQELIARYKVMVRKLVEDGGGAIDEKEWIMLHYFLNHGVMNLAADLDFIPSGELMNLYLQVLHTARTLEGKHLALKGIGASSTEGNHTIHCTLCYLNLDRNWRSQPSSTGGPQVNEFLIFGPTSRELYLFSHITVSFFREIEHWDQPVYAPKYVRFHFGHSPKHWHSCTPKFAVAQDVDEPQSFQFLPFLSWGRFVKLQFFGKTTRDEGVEAPYFVSVESVHLYGLKVHEFTKEKALLRAHMFHHCESLAPASSIKPLELNDKQVLELVEEFRSRGPDELDPHFLQTRVKPLVDLGAFEHSKFRGQCIEQPALLEHAVNSQIQLKGVVTFPVLDLLVQILLIKKNKDVRFISFVSFMQDAASYADREALRVLIRRHLKELELKVSINLLLRVDFVDDALDLALSSYPKSVLFQQLLSLYKLGSGKVPINVSRLYERLGEKFSGAELRQYIERRSWVIKHVGNHEEVWDFLKGLEMYLDGDKSGMASSLGAASSGALGVQQVVAQHQSMSSMQQLLTAEDIMESSGALQIPHFNN